MLLSANKNRKFVDEFVAVVQPTVLSLLSVINAPIVGKIQERFLTFLKILLLLDILLSWAKFAYCL